MRRAKRWLLFIPAAVLLLSLLASTDAALPFKKVSIAKTPASTTTSTTTTTTPETQETAGAADDEEQQVPPSGEGTDTTKDDNVTISKNSKLTGIPQIDYIWDPNLPRELRGYNLSSYPFLSTVPPQDEIHFKCEGLHDGFYASIEYKCQIYHHCVYGIRHDFLCANFTAFDQRTFICHFASDVDCEGSQKYWNRNDELYMATTTTSTSTTTTEPPPTQPHRRRVPQRPQRRRPYDHRRPIDDYYYDEEEEQQQYEDDYYEERFNRRQKTKRQRHRKPIKEVDYDDEYEDEKPAAAPPPRRNRNRYRDEDEDQLDEDYDDRRGNRRRKPATAGRKISARKPQAEGRRSFNEDRAPLLNNRRRANEKRLGGTTPSSLSSAALDDLDDYEKPYADVDQEEAAEEQTPQKVKTSTAKTLTEFITPKAAAASVYARPRAPPRIARPVPINEKKKYSYPVQKTNTATTTPKTDLDEDYYQQEAQQEGADDEYDQLLPVARSTLAPSRRRPAGPTRNPLRKPVTEKKAALEEDYYEEPPTTRRRQQQQQARPQARTRAPPPSSAADVDFLDEEEQQPIRGQRVRSKQPAPRKSIPRPRQPIVDTEEIHADEKIEAEAPPSQRPRVNLLSRRKQTRQRTEVKEDHQGEPTKEEQEGQQQQQHEDPEPAEELEPVKPSLRPSAVRVVKRPFLPSRGGSPYLPRGLQPVGVALKPSSSPAPTTQSTPIDMGSTISGVRLLEHGAPLLRSQSNSDDDDDIDIDVADEDGDGDVVNERRKQPAPPLRTTLPPRSALPPATPKRNQEPQRLKLNLDELYENDYDVTLNDALDPTLKPLSTHSHPHPHTHTHSHPHQQQQQQPQQPQQLQYRPYASAYNNPFAYQPQQQTQSQSQAQAQSQQSLSSLSASSSPAAAAGGYHSDSYFSSTDIRRRAIVGPSPQGTRSHRHEYPAAGGSAAATSSNCEIKL